ncbi:unnamed protein product [Trypanosoma congolense IL3000]|uniref:WGS project CAEQ00000000 data, annotated contig 844 n=1 Tax=Trypanosoma congolense (strain IL3000) TaxID=1068625 RepID=F9WIX7_TRYCI|nr:unnamed protein product [Trypanosoma congolense IL3000]
MEGGGVKRTRDEMEGEAVAPVEQAEAPARDQVTAATDAAARPVAVRHEVVAGASGRWTLDSSVKEVLLEDCGGLSDVRLHDFLMKHFGETFGCPSVSMSVFMDDPSVCVSDEAVLRRITKSSAYREYELYKTMGEGVERLNAREIFSLRQWEGAVAANEVEDINAYVRGKLNAALLSVRRNEETIRVGDAPSDEEIDGAYDSVFNARWSYVVRSDTYDKKWLGMGVVRVGEGEQPHLWSEEQADVPYDPKEPWEGDVVPGVSGKLVMATLKSQKGWPYMLFRADEIQKEKAESLTEYNAVCDAYIRRENLRVWHIVKKGLVEWLNGVKSVHPFIVIGAPGIGKSFATGSLLLYQMLHYKPEWLKVVAYFVDGKAYIFHREDRRVVYYEEQAVALRKVNEMISKGVKGYIIFDMGGSDPIIDHLPRSWGIVLITSPNVKNFHEFAKQRQCTTPIYMNCYEDAEFKAALVWERKSQLEKKQIKLKDVNLENIWKALDNRIYVVGPLPRYVLGDGECFRRRVIDVNAALSKILVEDVNRYARHLSNKAEWYVDDTTNKIVKLVRVRSDWPEESPNEPLYEPRNKAVSTYVRGRILRKAMENFAKLTISFSELVTTREWCAFKFESSGVLAFTVGSVVTEVVRHLKYLPREGETERSRTSVLARVGASGLLPTSVHQLCFRDKPVEIVTKCLYQPAEDNFPVVDGFFLVDAVGSGVSFPEGAAAPTQTIVLIQVTKARDHHTTTSKVEAFRKRMARSFTNWTEMESRLSYEIIYVQHAESTTLTGRQRCARSGVADDTVIEEFWSGIHQFLVKLEAPIAKLILQDIHNVATEEVTCGESNLRYDPEKATDDGGDAVGEEAQSDVAAPDANVTTVVDIDRVEDVTGIAREVRDANITTVALDNSE